MPRRSVSVLPTWLVIALAVCLVRTSSVAPIQAAASVDGVTGLPTDVAPLLSIAGIWQPIADRFIDPNTTSPIAGEIANAYAGNVVLPNGREGLVVTGWSFNGFGAGTSITPVNMAILEQDADGRLRTATSKYVADPQTSGGANVLAADFNNDGVQDLFLPAHNESPFLPASSTAYISALTGTYQKVTVGDSVQAHGATVAFLQGTPTIFTANYYVAPPPNKYADTATQYSPTGFTVDPDIGTGGNSSVAVGDFYGDGTYSLVCGDCKYGPSLSFDPTGASFMSIQLWKLAGLHVAGDPVQVGTPYFNGKPEYAGFPSQFEPAKTHNVRAWLDDFNHDGALDIVVQSMIWSAAAGQSKNVLQMFQNKGAYRFADVTDSLNAQYDQNCFQNEFVPQSRDIDASSVNSYLLGSPGDRNRASGNYVIVNDGSGVLHIALHDTLETYARQVTAWLAANPDINNAGYFIGLDLKPAIRAYRTPNGKLNFVAIAGVTKRVSSEPLVWVRQYIFVNLPLELDLTRQFTRALTVKDRNGSYLIRTFAGDDTIYAGNDNGYARIDGGLGVNTIVYSGPSHNYTLSRDTQGSWVVQDHQGPNGVDTLVRVQRLQFTDRVVDLNLTAPVITAVRSAASGQPGVVPGSFVSIYGSNFTPTPLQDWSRSISGGNLPAELAGASVAIGGKPAYISAVTPGQINVQAPDVGTGDLVVTVTTPAGTSAPFTANSQPYGPAFWPWPGNQPVATHLDFSIAARNGTFAGTATVPPKPGEVIILWGTGFGPVDPAVPAGQLPGAYTGAPTLRPVIITLNGTSIPVLGAVLSGYPGVYQIAVQIPANAKGDYTIGAEVNGVRSPGMTLTVE